jgi:hypothetical protein
MQPPDTTQLQNYAREREQGGTRQLMLALAAQEAGKEFAPAQAHFLKQAAAARDPMKFGGGLVAETGEFVADPSAQADLKIRQAGMRIQAIERQIQAAQSAQERAALQAERLNAQAELRSMMMQFQAGQDARASADRRYGVDMAHENAKIAAAAKPGPKDKVAENAAKNAAAGKEVLGLLDEAEKHLDNATSSYIGYGVDQGLRAFGGSTKGSRATAALQTIGGQIVSKMPRMEGPQSNYDVKLYQQMAGRLDDPTVPLGDKKVALQTLRDLNDKYAIGGAALSPGGGATGGWSVEVEK